LIASSSTITTRKNNDNSKIKQASLVSSIDTRISKMESATYEVLLPPKRFKNLLLFMNKGITIFLSYSKTTTLVASLPTNFLISKFLYQGSNINANMLWVLSI
jgi:hypothetical protein